MSEARVRVSLTDGVLEVEGSENFVKGLVEKFSTVIQTALAGEPAHASDDAAADARAITGVPPNAASAASANAEPSPEVAFGDIFAPTASGVQVLRTFPGSTKATRALNLAKLYLYGLQALKQRDTAFFFEIARVCKAHGCYDANNMAASLKADRTSFVFGGTGKRQTLKLSVSGIHGTEALIARMRAGGNGISERNHGIPSDSMESAGRNIT